MKRVKIAIIAAVLVALPVVSFFVSKAVIMKSAPIQESLPAETVKIDRIVSSGLLAEKSVMQLIAESDVIVYGTVISKDEPVKIRPVTAVREEETGEDVSGSFSIFTDYYIEPEMILQNRSGDENLASIPIRMEGGIIEELEVIAEEEPPLEIGQKYLLFLAHPGRGGGYNTGEYQFYISGAIQGVYQANGNDAILRTLLGEEITLGEVVQQIEAFDASGEAVQTQWERFVENQNRNLENGFITQEEYDRFIEEAQMYAEIIE